jgi:hypothetical protein
MGPKDGATASRPQISDLVSQGVESRVVVKGVVRAA